MKPKIYDHPESITSIDPSSARLITQSKERVAHKKQSLNGRDVAVIKRSTEQIADTISELPTCSPDIGGHFAKFEARAELRGSKVDGVQQDAREVGTTRCHVSHEGRTICDHKRMVLSVPVEIQ